MAKEYDLNPDGSLNLNQDLGDLFDPELDEIHSVRKSHHVEPESTVDREKFERELTEWCDALLRYTRDALRSDGIQVTGVTPSLGYDSYRVHARDATARHRDYSVDISVDRALALSQMAIGRTPLHGVAAEVVAMIRAARAKYHRRMVS